MDKTRILLASFLKPVNEPRMYEKIGKSLMQLPEAEIHICGYRQTASLPVHPNLFFHPLFSFRRLSLGRFTAQFKYLKFLFSLKPGIVVAATHELLPATIIYKLFSGCVLIYDVQENYYRNLMHQKVYPNGIRQLLAYAVRSFEWLTSGYIKHFLLAERNYALQLPFLKGRYLIIENKFKPPVEDLKSFIKPAPVRIDPSKIKLLYTGTISEEYGIFQAIKLADEFYKLNQKVTLTIIGYCAKTETLEKLQQLISERPYINLTGGKNVVAYAEILKAIQMHHVGLVPYQSTDRFTCIPTKIFEYIACRLPMLIQHNPYWEELVKSHSGGIFLNYQNPEITDLYYNLLQTTFYKTESKSDVLWQTEEQKLLEYFGRFLKSIKD